MKQVWGEGQWELKVCLHKFGLPHLYMPEDWTLCCYAFCMFSDNIADE